MLITNICPIYRHIQEHLDAQQLPIQKKVEDMTEDEKNYMYFKVHDLDGNDKLDGLEIFYSATHHSASEHDNDHNHDHDHKHSETNGNDETDEINQSLSLDDNSSTADVTNFNLLEFDENGQVINKNLNHIIGE